MLCQLSHITQTWTVAVEALEKNLSDRWRHHPPPQCFASIALLNIEEHLPVPATYVAPDGCVVSPS